ncbi:hypothetical protein ACF0H5_004709 [Mactra antiquata]
MSEVLLATKMGEDLTGSTNDNLLSNIQGDRCLLVRGGGSELFRSVLEDYVHEVDNKISKSEFNRYKSKQMNKDKNDDDHSSSRRCESCQTVISFCKCEQYHGRTREFGHRVHWADEVWEKPLITFFEENDEPSELCFEDRLCSTSFIPKPILKHRANCIVIISE